MLTVLACGGAFACSRTGLSELVLDTPVDGFGTGGAAATEPSLDTGGAPPSTADAGATAASSTSTAATPPPSSTSTAAPPKAKPSCTPHDETCNGIDDDCNGTVDDGLPPIPCAGGGEQFCVAGRYSACPKRCETCIPGTERVCFLSYCTFWAAETCAADGRSFGTCEERHVPPECADVSSLHHDSAELEQCCVDNGYCCHDEYDLDGDGNRNEMLGRCDEVACGP